MNTTGTTSSSQASEHPIQRDLIGALPAGHTMNPLKPSRWAPTFRARSIAFVTVAGVLACDLLLFSGGFASLGTTLMYVVIALGVLIGLRPNNAAVRWLVAAVLVFAPLLTIRTSAWVVAPIVIVSALAIAWAPAVSLSSGQMFTVSGWVRGLASSFVNALMTPLFIPGFVRRFQPLFKLRGLLAAVRIAAVVVPVSVLLIALLRLADPIFAKWIRVPELPLEQTMKLAFGAAVGVGWAIAAIGAATTPSSDKRARVRLFSSSDLTALLATMTLVLAVFTASQVAAAVGGAKLVASTAGVTWASYSRSGYFPLLWAVALIFTVLTVSRQAAKVTPSRLHFGFVGLIGLLTVGIVASAVRRLLLYMDAYGPTMLRVASVVFAGWIAVVVVLTVVWWTGFRGDRVWLTPAIAVLAATTVFVWGIANPEGRVATTLMSNNSRSIPLDTPYLLSLGNDGMVVVLRSILETEGSVPLSAVDRKNLVTGFCSPDGRYGRYADRGYADTWGDKEIFNPYEDVEEPEGLSFNFLHNEVVRLGQQVGEMCDELTPPR